MLFNIYKEWELSAAEVRDVFRKFRINKVVSFDIETSFGYNGRYEGEGLDPYLSTIAMLQVGTEEDQLIIDPRITSSTYAVQELVTILVDPEILVVGHNLVFEYKFMKHFYDIEITNLYDTMVVDQIINNGKQGYRYGLASVAKARLGIEVGGKGTTQTSFLRIGDRPYTKEQIEYGAQDVIVPLLIRDHQLPDIAKYNLQKCVSLEMKFTPILGDMSLKGMHFDVGFWVDLHKQSVDRAEKLRTFIFACLQNDFMHKLPTKFIDNQGDLFDESKTHQIKINLDSPEQVKELFSAIGIAAHNDEGKLSVDASVLRVYLQLNKNLLTVDQRDIIHYFIEYKKARKNCTTYGMDFLKHVNPITGRVHSDYKQILNTGRISSKNPNLQNIPAGAHRRAFTAPEGFKIVNADYSGQEQIILANKSKEPNLIKFYESGEVDMHSYIARLLFDEIPDDLALKEVKSQFPGLRQIAKAAGFAINYGGNGYTIASNLGIEPAKGEEVYEAYFKAFPELKNYFDKVQKDTLFNKYILIDKATRRICHINLREKDFYNSSGKAVNKVKRDALNYPIQGEAGSITKLAAIFFKQEIKKHGLEKQVFITNLIHDEINVEAWDGIARFAGRLLEQSMKKAGDIWCKTVPLTAKAVVGDYWAH